MTYIHRYVLVFLTDTVLCAVFGVVWYAYGDTCQDFKATPHHFIMTAFPPETEAVRNEGVVSENCRLKGVRYELVRFEPENTLAVLFEGGVGPERAQYSAETTLEAFEVLTLTFSGVAGGIDSTLPLTQTVVAESWLELESGARSALDDSVRAYVARIPNVTLVPLGATARNFIEDIRTLPEGVSVVDMETYIVAEIARNHEIPFVAFRSVSDFADGVRSEGAFEHASVKSALATRTYLKLLSEHLAVAYGE